MVGNVMALGLDWQPGLSDTILRVFTINVGLVGG